MRIIVEVDEGRVSVTGERSPHSLLPVHAVVAAISAAVHAALTRHHHPETAAGGDALTGDRADASPPAAPAAELPDPEPATPEPVPAPERTTGQLRADLAAFLAQLEENSDVDVRAVAETLGCSTAKARHLLVEAGAL